ncbi:ATP-binding cassette sub-family G member 1 [Ixodes scapularis]
MDSDAVLINVSKLESESLKSVQGIDNVALDLSTTLDVPKLSANGHASNGSSMEKVNGSRNYESIRLEWKNLTFKVKSGKEKKALVSNLSGLARPGTLTAIMGPSGAGKTTLLNLLTGFYDKNYEGEVQINGYVRDQQLFNKQSCYVMQEDRLLPALTVHEAITMSVELRMPMMKDQEKKEKVHQSIDEWGLFECRNTRTENLSGGQRKRLAIAQELVNNPPVLFLDEPTSGLDNVSSLMCVEILKRLAEQGHTVICSIHTPSAKIFSHFDMLYMVSQGRCIYNGQVDGLLGFLSKHNLNCPHYHNPADYIAEVAAGDYGNYVDKLSSEFTLPLPVGSSNEVEKFRTKYGGRIMSAEVKTEVNRNYSFKVNQSHQFKVLLKRCWLSMARNKVATPLRFLAYVAFAIMIVMLYYDIGRKATTVLNNANMYFAICCICIFQSLLPAVIVFPIEISVLMRENRNCWYSIKVYYLANYITEIPFLTIPIALLIGISYYPTAQPLVLWRVAGVMLFCIQLCSVTQSMGLIVSAVTKLQTAVFVAMPVVSPSFFFSGFFVQEHLLSPWVSWITKFSPIHYAYHGMLLSVYGYDREPLECDDFVCLYENPSDFLEFTGTSEKKFYALSLSLVAFEVAFRLLAFVLLKFRLSKRE